MNDELKLLLDEFCSCSETEAVVLGGSRSGESFDTASDYDIYVYVTERIPEEKRSAFYQSCCSHYETGNHYFEYEDNIILNSGTYADIIFRSLEDIKKYLSFVVDGCNAFNGYTTCFWHNIIRSEILFDRDGRYEEIQKKYTIPYPKKLRDNIIKRNMSLLHGFMPSYDKQILKAVSRDDAVSINHRTAAFTESYFDVIFAMNEMTHPGEKKLIDICKKQCSVLPDDFEGGLRKLYADMYGDPAHIGQQLEHIVQELEKTLRKNGIYNQSPMSPAS